MTLCASVVLLSSVLISTAEAQTLTITSPSASQRLAAGADYATDVLGDPWDMNNVEDISQYPYDRPGWGNDFGFSNGRLGGTTVPLSNGVVDTSIALLYRGFYNTVNTGRSGRRFPIDPNVYKRISVKLSGGVAGQYPVVYWFHKQWGEPGGGLTGQGDGVKSAGGQTVPGYKIFANDLSAPFGGGEGGEPWTTALVRGLRIDPNGDVAGQQVFFDWVRLTRGDDDPAAVRHTIRWSGGSGTTTIQVIDSDGVSFTIASGLSSSTTEYSWAYGFLPPGTYTLRVTRGGSTADRAFSINDPPRIQITNPDETGGEDYATTVLGNAWDMNDAADVARTLNLTGSSFSGGQFHGTSNASGDPSLYLLYQTPQPISSARYRYLTFSLQVDRAFDLGRGSIARMLYGSISGDPSILTTTRDIIVWPGMNSYTVDLGSLTTATDGGLEAGGSLWTSAAIRHLRLDPFEFPEGLNFHIADVKLAAVDEAAGSFAIAFTGADSDDNPSVSLYYDTDTDASNGKTLIVSNLALSSGGYTWNTSSVTSGTYYIYAEVTDGLNTQGRYSTGPVVVAAAVTPPPPSPTPTPSPTPLPTASSVDLVAAGSRGVVMLNNDIGGDSFRYNPTTGNWGADFSTADQGYTLAKSGSWTPGWTVQAADFDGDGLTDLFLYNPANGSWAKAVNNGSADFTYFSSSWSPGWTAQVIDLDGDGRSDVFLYNAATGAWFKCVSVGSGVGDFAYSSGSWTPGWQIYPADLNGDRRGDLFLYNRTTGQWVMAFNDGAAAFTYVGGSWSPGWDIYPGDYNGDGLTDLFIYNTAAGNWFVVTNAGGGNLNYSPGAWEAGWTIRRGDLNGDGRADLFLYKVSNGVWVEAFSNGGGGWTYAVGNWSPGWQIHLTDLNLDRRSDVLLYNGTTGSYFQAVNTSNGAFTYQSGNWGPGWQLTAMRTITP